MRVKLGIWHSEYALYMATPLPPGRWSLLVERRHDGLAELVLGSDNAGLEQAEHLIDGEVHIYGYRYLIRQDRPADCKIARCSLMALDMREHATNLWSVILPPDNLMPWPQARECNQYTPADELFDECVKRRAYAKQFGGSFTPPPEVTRRLTAQQRRRLFALDEREAAA